MWYVKLPRALLHREHTPFAGYFVCFTDSLLLCCPAFGPPLGIAIVDVPPEGVQMDFEAIMTPSPAQFIAAVKVKGQGGGQHF